MRQLKKCAAHAGVVQGGVVGEVLGVHLDARLGQEQVHHLLLVVGHRQHQARSPPRPSNVGVNSSLQGPLCLLHIAIIENPEQIEPLLCHLGDKESK